MLIVNNLSAFARPADLDLKPFVGMTPVGLLEPGVPRIADRPYFLSLSTFLLLVSLDRPEETPSQSSASRTSDDTPDVGGE